MSQTGGDNLLCKPRTGPLAGIEDTTPDVSSTGTIDDEYYAMKDISIQILSSSELSSEEEPVLGPRGRRRKFLGRVRTFNIEEFEQRKLKYWGKGSGRVPSKEGSCDEEEVGAKESFRVSPFNGRLSALDTEAQGYRRSVKWWRTITAQKLFRLDQQQKREAAGRTRKPNKPKIRNGAKTTDHTVIRFAWESLF